MYDNIFKIKIYYLKMLNKKLKIKEIKTSFTYLIILSFVDQNFSKEIENDYNKLFINWTVCQKKFI